jgi:4,5-DOPA dioxygenase extradiol
MAHALGDAPLNGKQQMASKLPAFFIGHGSPENARAENAYTRAWRRMGAVTPRPKAILSISAHWSTHGTAVTAAKAPGTIHDFHGFPAELSRIRYEPPGDPALALRVRDQLAPVEAAPDYARGLDHGIWAVLRHIYPQADIPVVQLSIDESRDASFHFDIGRRLAPLREEGILVIGSGAIVHNPSAYDWRRQTPEPFDWVRRFEVGGAGQPATRAAPKFL